MFLIMKFFSTHIITSSFELYLNYLVCFIVFQAIDGADGFQNTHQPQHYESAKFSIEQVCSIVKKDELLNLEK